MRFHEQARNMNAARRQAGFSLIELMIAAVIGLVLLGGVISISINSSRTQRELEQVGRQIENGRYAVDILGEALSHAGFYGEYYELEDLPGALPDPCDTTLANIEAAIPVPVQGLDDPTGNPYSCLADANHRDGTDVVVIRRASTSPTAITALTANELYLQTRASNQILAQAVGNEDAANPGSYTLDKRDGTTANIRKFHVEIYFIGPDETVSDVPVLSRLTLQESGGALSIVQEDLVEGVEYFEVEYGIDRDDDGIADETAVGNGDAYERANDVSLSEFGDVVSLKLHLVARSTDTFAGHSDGKVYDLGLETDVGPLNDAYRRHAFSATIRAANLALRRE